MAKRRRLSERKDPLVVTDSSEDGTIAGADETATRVWRAWKETREHLRKWRQEAAESYDFVAGKQWSVEEENTLKDQLRPVVTFNRMAPTLDAVAGYEINSRQDVTAIPREPDSQPNSQGGADLDSAAIRYFREQCDAEDEESDAFYDLLTCGLGCIEQRMDYDDDPEGMIKIERVDPLEMGYDPAAMKRNLSDRRWDIRGKWWDRKVAEATWPDADFSEANNIAGDQEDTNEKAPIDRIAASFYKDTGIGEEYERRKGKVFILEHTWFENESFISAVNPLSGQMEEIAKDKLDKLNTAMKAAGYAAIRSVKRTRKVFKRAFVHGRTTLEEGDAPCPHKFHYQFMTGKRDRNVNVWYGLARQMKDPQRWANKWLSQTLHILNSNVKGTTEYEDGAFENVSDVEARIAKPNAFIKIEQGYFDKVRVREAAGMPPTTMNLTEFAIGSIRDATGVNTEVLGNANRDQPGIVEHARKQSAMSILAPLFNSLRNYHKQAGRLTLYFIKTYMADGRLIRIAGPGNAKFLPLTKQKDFDKYDVKVDESPSSPNQKEAVFGALGAVLPGLMKAGVPVPPNLLKYVPGLPQQLVDEWLQYIQQKAAQPQQQDPKTQLAQQKLQQDAQEAQNQDRLDSARLQFDQQKMVADSQRAAAEMEVKKLELQIRLREMDAKERMELTKLSGKIVQDHQQRVHDQAEGAIDRLHEHHQNELDRAHASDEGEKNRKAASERPPANA